MDDLLVFANDEDMVNALKQLMTSFQMKDQGYPEQILGMHVTQADRRICLDQEKYIDQLLEQFGLVDCILLPRRLMQDRSQVFR